MRAVSSKAHTQLTAPGTLSHTTLHTPTQKRARDRPQLLSSPSQVLKSEPETSQIPVLYLPPFCCYSLLVVTSRNWFGEGEETKKVQTNIFKWRKEKKRLRRGTPEYYSLSIQYC